MADKKFSQFTLQPTPTGSDELVGLSGSTNVKMEISTINRNNLDGTLAIASGGTGSIVAGVSTVGTLLDEGSQVIGDNLVIQDDGAGNSVLATGFSVNIKPPKCQITISGTGGLSNTNNTSDFRVPYNNTVANDTSYFTPVISGGLGTQGTIEVLQAGTYYLNARYSTFDLVQPSLPTVDGTKFMRITATVNGVKSCVLQNLIIATSGNGEATINGSQVMDLSANDVVEITAFHTGATGGSGSQGFPVSANTFFNEPTLTLVKIG